MGAGPEIPKCVQSVSLVKEARRLPVRDWTSSVMRAAVPESSVSQWEGSARTMGTRAGKMRGVVVWPSCLAKE